MKTTTHKLSLLLLILVFFQATLIGQNVGINATGAAPDASASLDIVASDKGVLIPRVSISTALTAAPVTSPTTSLIVYNTNASITAGNGVGYYYWNGTQWVQLSSAGDDWSLLGNSGTTAGTNFIGTTDAVDWVVKTDNTERIRVKATGNVGVGTAIPFAKFHVVASGTTGILGYSSGSNVSGVVAQSTGTNSKGIQATSDLGTAGKFTLSGSGTSIISAFDGATEVFTVDDGGFVGIGTTAPGAMLEIQSSVADGPEAAHFVSSGSRTGIANPIGFLVENTTSGNVQHTRAMSINCASTSTYFAGTRFGLHIDATSAFTGTLMGNVGLHVDVTGAGSTFNHAAIFEGGEVGIGLTSPKRMLHVNDVMRLEPRATVPSSAGKGDIYFDSTTNKLMVYDGTTWQACW